MTDGRAMKFRNTNNECDVFDLEMYRSVSDDVSYNLNIFKS